MHLNASWLVFAFANAALLFLTTAANAQYVGVTTEGFDGGQGVFTYNRACHAAHPGSRMCTSQEIMSTVNPPVVGNPDEKAWVRPVYQPTGSISRIDVSGASSVEACEGWSAGNGYYGLVVQLDTGSFYAELMECNIPNKVTCCIPVPEPSASLTIPSGVAMVFAMAKLRGVSLIR
jgi:hypothetical protein